MIPSSPPLASKPYVAKFPFLAPGSPSLRAIEIRPSKRDFKKGRGGGRVSKSRFRCNPFREQREFFERGKGSESIREEALAKREREREGRSNRRCPSLEVISISSLGHRGKVDFCLLCHSWSTFDSSILLFDGFFFLFFSFQ